MNNLNRLSEQLLLAVKKEESFDQFLVALENFSSMELEKQLHTDHLKNAFWINIYNSFFQILRKNMNLIQPKIYTSREMTIANQKLSLDDIEHGILRHYRYKYSLGFFINPFVSNLIKKWAVTKIDFRIHFALNCGAISCPPIAFYTVENLETHLEVSSFNFIQHETQIDNEKKKVYISRLFLWFLNDFGGRKGTKKILKKYLKQNFSGYKIIYNSYSWEEKLDNYVADDFENSSI